MKKKLSFIIVFCLLVIGFVFSTNFNKTGETSINGILHTNVSADRKNYSSVEDLKKNSDIVVMGTIKGKLKSYNLNRNSNSEIVILGTDYEFEVQRYLKGAGDKTIIVIQEGGQTDKEIQIFDDRTEMDINGKYFLFLNKVPDVDKYRFGGNPYKFKVSNGKVKVDAGDDFLMNQIFPQKSMAEFISKVESN